MAGILPGYLQDMSPGGSHSRSASPARPLIAIDLWLDSLGLLEYSTLFSPFRYVQDLFALTELDLRDRCGIKNGAHRARLISSLVMLRESSQRQRSRARTPNQFEGISSSLPSLNCGLNSPGGGCACAVGPEFNGPRTAGYQQSSSASSYYASPKKTIITGNDMSGCFWYHSSISRVSAEEMVKNNGDFLVRDSSTQHGDFVLTARWNGVALHFVVNRRLVPGTVIGSVRSVYHFEEDVFDSVAELIHFYVKHRKPVTEASGTLICNGVPSAKFIDETPVTLAKYGSQPLLNSACDFSSADSPQAGERRLSVPSIAKMTAVEIPIDESQNSVINKVENGIVISPASISKVNSDTGTVSDSDLGHSAPPKPSRVPTVKIAKFGIDKRPVVPIRNKALYEDDGKDYSDYDQVKNWPEKMQSLSDVDSVAENINLTLSMAMSLPSRFGCDEVINHESQFLTPDNRPLESSAVTLMKSMIFETPPAVLAFHITRIDLELLKITLSNDLGHGVSSGLELITLPQGRWLRQDIIERFHCLRLFVSVLVLKCSSSDERARMIHLWIQTAIHLQSAACGNLLAFSSVMHALLSSPISRLSSLWLQLRKYHAASSIAFENRLCSLQRSSTRHRLVHQSSGQQCPTSYPWPSCWRASRSVGQTSTLSLVT